MKPFSSPFPQHEVARHRELPGVDLDQHVVHHARRVVLRAVRAQPRAVRHGAGRDPLDLGHLVGRHHRDRRWHLVAVEVEVHDVGQIAVGRHRHRRREKPQLDAADRLVVSRGVLPERAVRRAVAEGDEVVLAVGRDGDAVRAVDIGGQHAGGEAAVQPEPAGTEADAAGSGPPPRRRRNVVGARAAAPGSGRRRESGGSSSQRATMLALAFMAPAARAVALRLHPHEVQPAVEVVHVRQAVLHHHAPGHRRVGNEAVRVGRLDAGDLAPLGPEIPAQLARDVERPEPGVVGAHVERVARDPDVVHPAVLRLVPRDLLRLLDVAHVDHVEPAVGARGPPLRGAARAPRGRTPRRPRTRTGRAARRCGCRARSPGRCSRRPAGRASRGRT